MFKDLISSFSPQLFEENGWNETLAPSTTKLRAMLSKLRGILVNRASVSMKPRSLLTDVRTNRLLAKSTDAGFIREISRVISRCLREGGNPT